MTDNEFIRERAAIIWEGESYPLGLGRFGHRISYDEALAMARDEFDQAMRRAEDEQQEDAGE